MSYVNPGTVAIALVGWFAVPILLKATVLKPAASRSKKRLDGKVVLVTGANTGLGKVTTGDLSARGATVYMACRDLIKAESARQDILKSNPQAKLKVLKLDLGSLASVKACADSFLKEEDRLDILVANAGFGAFGHNLTVDGVESHLGCNHLGHFYLTRLLLPSLEAAGTQDAKSRIVVLSSRAHELGVSKIDYEGLQNGKCLGFAYGMSKLANILFTRYLSQLLADRNVTVNAVHPGTVKTEFFRYYIPLPNILNSLLAVVMFPVSHLAFTELEGTQTQLYAALDENLEGVSGQYLQHCSISKPSDAALDDAEAEKLWKWSCDKTGLTSDI